MADATLHGNGEECPACALRRERIDKTAILQEHVPCNHCRHTGRVALPAKVIYARAVADARSFYWPAKEALWARENAKGAVVAPAPLPWPPVALPWAQASFAF